jgi:hypothetical protein
VLLDGLVGLFDDGGLGDLTDWGKSVGSGCWGSNSDWGGNGKRGSMSVGKRSSGISKRCTSICSSICSSIAKVCSSVTQRCSGVGSGVSQLSSNRKKGGLGGHSQDSENNLL